MRGYTGDIALLVDAASEAAGRKIDPVDFLEALVRRMPEPRARARGVPRYQGLAPLSPGGLKVLLARARNRRLANDVARLMMRVWSSASVTSDGYGLYCALAQAAGLQPWGPDTFNRQAYGYRCGHFPEGHVLL